MNPYAIPSLVVGCINLALCIYVLRRNPRGSLTRPFALLMVPLILWPIGEYFARSVATIDMASVLVKVCWAIVAFIPATLLNFTHTFPKALRSRREMCVVAFLFLIALGFASAIMATDYVISGAVVRPWGFDATRGVGFSIFAAYFCLLLSYGLMTMLRKTRSLGYPERISAKYITLGISIPIIVGGLSQVILPLYKIDILPIASLSTLAISIFIGVETTKYKWMVRIPTIGNETILNTLSDAVFVVDEEGKIISANRMMKQMLEYDEIELLYKPLENFVREDQRIYMTAGWMLDERGVRDHSCVWQSKSGKEIPVRLTTSPIKGKYGQIGAFVGVARDARRETTLEQIVKSSMDQLKESQGKYRTLVENSLDGICILQDDKIQFANEKLQEMTGYTLAELNQKDFWQLIVPDMRELVRNRALKRLGGDPVTERYEIQALTKDGRTIDLEILAAPTEYQGRRATQGCVRDITENKRLREKLGALYKLGSELSLSLNLEQICDRVLKIVSEVLDFDNCAIMLLSDETNELTISAQMGYPADVGGLTIPLAGDKGLTAEVARTGKSIYVPDVTKDGRYVQGIPEARSELAIPLAVKNRVIGVLNVESAEVDAFSEQDMQLLGTLGYHASIAIQTSSLFEKVTQKALELSAVVEIAKALTSSVDIDVVKPTVLDELKKAIPYDLGVLYLYDKKEQRLVMGAQKGFSPEEARERERTALERHPGTVFTRKTPLLVKDVDQEPRVQYSENMRKPASLLYVPLIFQDKALGAIGLASFEKDHFSEKDLSLSTAVASEVAIAIENARLVKDLATAKVNLQKLNEELERKVVQRTKDLEEAQGKLVRKEKLATLGQLAGSVAHELRNPLAVIRNSLYCANHRLTQPDPKVRRHLEIIDEQVSRADSIIEDLLDYSKTKVAKKKEVALNKFATTVLGNLSIPNNIKVAIKLSNNLPEIRLDQEQIGRLIANLVKNAIEAMPEGGELLLESGMQNGYPVLKIVDTGSGIPDKDLKEIFQPLFTTKARGIGLGLALGKSLAHANGVEIEVRSRVGEGSAFSLVFKDQSLPATEAGGES